jgi:hypothetical protein
MYKVNVTIESQRNHEKKTEFIFFSSWQMYPSASASVSVAAQSIMSVLGVMKGSERHAILSKNRFDHRDPLRKRRTFLACEEHGDFFLFQSA